METKLEKTENTSELRYLTPVEMDVKSGKKYCRFKKMKIKYIDYKEPMLLQVFLCHRILNNRKSFLEYLLV